MSIMPKIWRNRIIGETQNFSDCPYKEQVIELLKQDVANGTITAEQYEQYVGEEYIADTTTETK